jgi:hypothetical protein
VSRPVDVWFGDLLVQGTLLLLNTMRKCDSSVIVVSFRCRCPAGSLVRAACGSGVAGATLTVLMLSPLILS